MIAISGGGNGALAIAATFTRLVVSARLSLVAAFLLSHSTINPGLTEH
jgi:hypothetical protein